MRSKPNHRAALDATATLCLHKVAIGILIGLVLAAGVLIGGRHFFRMTIPFKQESLGVGSHSHMKLFVHDLTEFHPGSFDTDVYQIWFRFGTRIQTAAEYFDRVEAGIRGSDWKLLDRHGGFSLYASEWKKSGPSALRLEIALNFDPRTRTVSFEERRRYEDATRQSADPGERSEGRR